MSSYLGNIVTFLRSVTSISFHDRIYMGNDINAIDTAYSETENHKASMFFVPGETLPSSGEMAYFLETNYFKAYLFLPVEDDVSATDAWEVAKNASSQVTVYISNWTDASKVKFLGGREFRVGRGYYIYVTSYCVDSTFNSYNPGVTPITYYKFEGETDGTATYTKYVFSNCVIDETGALSRNVVGIYNSSSCEVVISSFSNGSITGFTPTNKDFFVVGQIYDNSITSKADAVAAGHKVYEVNLWKDYYIERTFGRTPIGRRIVGA